MTDAALNTTPLTARHQALGAKMADFAGFLMPIQYAGIIAEHTQTRTQASLFDICHMGEFLIAGEAAKAELSHLLTHNLETLAPGRCRYGFLLNETGGVIDDCILYCLAQDHYMLVVNGARIEADRDWISTRLAQAHFEDVSDDTAKLDLQGPASLDVLEALLDRSLRHIPYFGFAQLEWQGQPLLVSRTGYTGELGYELYCPASQAGPLWDALLGYAAVKPAGLGARDTLRLEMGLPLYGHDLDETHTPAEAGYGGLLTSTADYIGKVQATAVREKLVGLLLDGRRSARHGDAVVLDGEQVGVITSGSFCPSLNCAAALAFIRADKAGAPGYVIRTARAELPAVPADLPFHKAGTARKKLA
ncbi:glycine cleavage system aminomethyltransferase GcvT [Megalodesulfovibrio gigas]|uniref:aminomethyltransferase n=1 Tax=Megalodesulfovibrio gigas (strain ATCC 19364 / DSM 1382 / NCIMB 9332 / VKM B-1759) TaxID=1121448 RepID=T2GBU6_MEGG1|nr:glycine cleavage system aminomethyltransferase GcvT [Megalodesulfovibrio gigas]AGW14050.1 putative glycine cleavage system T protein [Megalodesulfovibrio gigas DSM 1382 = ATCC 19364]